MFSGSNPDSVLTGRVTLDGPFPSEPHLPHLGNEDNNGAE